MTGGSFFSTFAAMTINWRTFVAGTVAGVLLASIVAAMIWPRHKPQPPAVATVTDTLVQVVNGETVYTVEYKPDPAASRELQKLRNEINNQRGVIAQLAYSLDEMDRENRYLADSLTRLTLDSLRGIVRVVRGPAGIAVVSYQHGLVETWRLPVWHSRWTLLAGKDAPVVKATRLPVDLGLFAAGGFDTPPDTWLPVPFAWAGLAITRQCMTAAVGPYFDGKSLRLRGEVRADWRL